MRQYVPIKTLMAIVAITTIEVTAIAYHVNGVALAAAIAAIAGLGGFAIGQTRAKKSDLGKPK